MAAVSFRTAVVIGGGESLTGVASVRYCRLENGKFLLLFYDPSWYGNRKKIANDVFINLTDYRY